MELVSILIIALAIAIIWIFRKMIKEWADRAQEVSAVTSYEVKKSSIDRMSKVTLSDGILEKAIANKTAMDSIDLI